MGVSFLMHSAVFAAGLFPALRQNTLLNEKKEIKEIKITVQEIQKKEISRSIAEKLKFDESKSITPPPYVKNIMRKLMGDDKERPSLNKPRIMEKNNNEIVISNKLENARLKQNPSYMSYYNGLRSRLEVICRKNYTGKSRGEVSLNFVLSRDGKLESVQADGNNQELIDTAVRSVKEAVPFSSFPSELKNQTAQFDVSITFKNN